jgi:hypothetical protein
MNKVAAETIRFAIALSVKEAWEFQNAQFAPATAYVRSCIDSERWIKQTVPRRYRKLALRALSRSRPRAMANVSKRLLTRARQAVYDYENGRTEL